ncbi:lycopene cyclase domain-containing protein [Corynebacterium sp. CCM 9185]|uniref:Lycopene cyclase domain-containing protein n=1 Tax=Corynebacterium marambiense TaxID=2765364 RepID=A0ABS0VVD3_9CORY|nr:lycopene cyclase domain-containing protein [Corynebacterium marambiense]MBI9000727.1 lycopene cyclase domain-containing protein [Corynebacterium marambiense]MCK7663010.1 lycopene cyclase domain-containing protein [Corynebacterium marambiense]
MDQWLYLASILGSILAMGLCDYRWRLTFTAAPARATVTSVLLVGVFLAWDGIGIVSGVFFRGTSRWMSGVELAPELPLEEPFFLFFLVYLALNLTSFTRMTISRTVVIR